MKNYKATFVIFLATLIISLLFKSPIMTLLSNLNLVILLPIINGIFACVSLMVRLALKNKDTSFSPSYTYAFISGILISRLILVFIRPILGTYSAQFIVYLSTVIGVFIIDGLFPMNYAMSNPFQGRGAARGGGAGQGGAGRYGYQHNVPVAPVGLPTLYIPLGGGTNQPGATNLANELEAQYRARGSTLSKNILPAKVKQFLLQHL